MIEVITLLLVLQLIGEVLARLLELPVPGPVIGMALLFSALMIRGKPVPDKMSEVVSGLLQHLSLLFIPAGVGVILYLGVIANHWATLSVTLLFSTLLTIAVTGWLMKKLGPQHSSSDHTGEDS